MAKNTHGVQKKQWAKWNKREQAAFNRLWHRMTPEMLPPEVKLTQKAFNVLRWNVCWIMADMMKDCRGEWHE
jgi:hypothetical protein